MATIKTQNNRRNAANDGWDVIHQETSADIVRYSDGTNVESNYVRQPGYGTTTGSANTYALTLSPAPTTLVDGLAICAKINIQNTGASTINVNGLGAKSILDSKGNAMTADKLKANTPYTMRYNGTNFILQGEGASGDAIASDLRLGKTASTDAGDIVGTNTDKKWATGSLVGYVFGQGQTTSLRISGLQFAPKKIAVGYYDINNSADIGVYDVAYVYNPGNSSYMWNATFDVGVTPRVGIATPAGTDYFDIVALNQQAGVTRNGAWWIAYE